MEKLFKNGFRTVSETELVLVDGGCPLPWCPGYDGNRNDRGDSPDPFDAPSFKDDSPDISWADYGFGIKFRLK